MSSHEPPSIEECIERKFSKALHKRLYVQPDFFKSHPDLKEKAVDAFIDSNGYRGGSRPSPGIGITDCLRLLSLVDKGVFTFNDIKDKIPKTDFRTMVTIESRFPGWKTNVDIISTLEESNLWWLRKVLFSAQKISEIHSEQTPFKHISDLEASYYVLNLGEKQLLKDIDSIPNLRQDLEDFLKVVEVHES